VERESIAGNEIGYIEIENNEDILKTKLQVGILFLEPGTCFTMFRILPFLAFCHF